MSEENINTDNIQLESGTYEIIRGRLNEQSSELVKRLNLLNQSRKEVFGSIATSLIANERITTEHNCMPRDMVPVGSRFIFGYNVHIGLKTETVIEDVFSVFRYGSHSFHKESMDLIKDDQFEEDFKNIYKYYRNAQFTKFAQIGPYLYMVLQVGKSISDIKAFKWQINGDQLSYIDCRSEHEVKFPDQHEFTWKRTSREYHKSGQHPHISIHDKVFVETIGGDLTIKVEDNTDVGHGIYSEPVKEKDQSLDDAEVYYAIVGNIVVLKIRPYQETEYRYIVYNEKLQEAIRIDALERSCVLLPDDHGVIFAKGFYLHSGEFKLFDNGLGDMVFEKRIVSPNGEDFLYVFYNESTGVYVLLSYNLIEQEVNNPIICHGYSIFENGELCYFKTGEEQKKHHVIQIWQTPYLDHNLEQHEENNSYLFKVGNKDIVRAMAECKEVIKLVNKEDSYTNLYLDIVKYSNDIVDSYHWLENKDAYNILEPLVAIKDSAASAIDEYEKVVRIKKNTREASLKVEQESEELFKVIRSKNFDLIDHFVEVLSQIRGIRGGVISLKELRYADLEFADQLEEKLQERQDSISKRCVEFLLKEKALKPYQDRVSEIQSKVDEVGKVVEAKRLEEDVLKVSGELEMLIEIVSNLKIEDATHTTKIIDHISDIYSNFNQINAALKKKRKVLLGEEGKSEFNSQIKLVSQGVVNYLDISDTPEKCDQYLTKLMVHLEELEGKFSEFDEFITLISEKREEVYNAFETRKVSLLEAQNRRANTLLQSAERILKGIKNRVAGFDSLVEINGYFASDLMVSKVRDVIAQLSELGDSVKSDDVQSRLKTVKEDAVRQLKDKTELYVDGKDIIQFGKHQFSVNTQPLDLTIVMRNDEMCYHLTGTNLFEPITDEAFLQTKEVWDQTIVSENAEVYRAEYLAYQLFIDLLGNKSFTEYGVLTENEQLAYVQKFMSSRYQEGYSKGVHDKDAWSILNGLLQIHQNADLLVYSGKVRAAAKYFWKQYLKTDAKEELEARIKSAGLVMEVFPATSEFDELIHLLEIEIDSFIEQMSLFSEVSSSSVAEYLFKEISRGDRFVISSIAEELHSKFQSFLKGSKFEKRFSTSIAKVKSSPDAQLMLMLNWVNAFVEQEELKEEFGEVAEETAVAMLCADFDNPNVVRAKTNLSIQQMAGDHLLINNSEYNLNYIRFMDRLNLFTEGTEVKFREFQQLKSKIISEVKEEMKLNEFKPRIMTSFVRNQLLDQVYLPLIGDNLAKQMGTVGENKRTDLMGMLLLISPPGYGKTTLMEYIAVRLGLVFMKINGPTIGHQVTSLDPSEAPNASAKEELKKLNLALEMGDNVMIYLDDIQHCNPELLQKFISLCDAQRKIEGVYKGKSKTYDLRGRKVAVVMAGNPYTESGEKFQVPDMLANRADIYNLGDIIGGKSDVFKLSYIENSLTSNPILSQLANKSMKDVYAFIKMAETGTREGVDFEASHSAQEVSEYISLFEKVLKVRDTLLQVNLEYIQSAGQEDKYRTEPSFKLQGSYRDMNKIVEKLVPIMNEEELEILLYSHYENESQTLTTGAESNLLKFKELKGWLTEEEEQRWEKIKAVFVKNQKLLGMGKDAQTAQMLSQMEAISLGLLNISNVMKEYKNLIK